MVSGFDRLPAAEVRGGHRDMDPWPLSVQWGVPSTAWEMGFLGS